MCIECCHDRYFVPALFHSLRIPQKLGSVKVHFGVKIGSFLGHGQKLEKSELKNVQSRSPYIATLFKTWYTEFVSILLFRKEKIAIMKGIA